MQALHSLVEELEQDRSLDEPERLRRRVEALDRLEAFLIDEPAASDEIHERARKLRTRLEAGNSGLYESIRRKIQRGAGRDVLLRWAQNAGLAQGDGYDYLDELVLGVLQFEEPSVVAEPGAEMVFYQPTPARHIFDLIARASLAERDVLVDLGSGLGHVPLLASICTSARSIGIELEPAYIDCARQSAEGLSLTNVSFLQQDARTMDFSVGTVFYLYTPFKGSILRDVLDSLRREADRRPIRVCTYGPCTATVAEEPWLEATGELAADRIAVFWSGS